MHQREAPLARTGGGGLNLVDSSEMLQFEARLADTSEAKDLYELVEKKVVRGASLEFLPIESMMDGEVRTITKARLVAIGVVDSPAYPHSLIETRARPMGKLEIEIPLESEIIESMVNATSLWIAADALDDSLNAIARGTMSLAVLRGIDYNSILASSSNGKTHVAKVGKKLRVRVDKLMDTSAAREVVNSLKDNVKMNTSVGVVALDQEIVEYTGEDGRLWKSRRVAKGGLCEVRLKYGPGGGEVKRKRWRYF